MKRLPLVASFLLFIALCASLAYWSLQLFKPPLRPVAAPPRVAQTEVRTEAASALFGGRAENVAVASNYQLHGIIYSGTPRDSVAILSTEGKPAQAVRVNTEVVPGVTVAEVHREYVLLSEGGTTKRVELPESAKGQVDLANLAPVPVQPSPPPSAPIPSRAQAAAAAAGMANGQAPATVTPPATTPAQQAQQTPPAGAPGSAPAPSGSPIPSGIVPSVQPPPAVPPTVVVSPPPSAQTGATATAPAAPAPAQAPATAAPAPQSAPTQPSAPATTPGFPPRTPSPDTAPLISR